MKFTHLPVITALVFLCFSPAAWADEPEKHITGNDGAKMALIEGDTFTMGSEEEDIKETAPPHRVRVDSFYMDMYEVTNEQFAKFLNAKKPTEGEEGVRYNWVVIRDDLTSAARASWWPTEISYEKGVYSAMNGFERYPVIVVSWYAANEYCKWAGKRLPTEAEWEFAARGGLKEKLYPWGNAIPTGGVIFGRTWTDNLAPPPTAPIGSYYPNSFGIYDMAGNVWEWVSDWYAPSYYEGSPRSNPEGPETGEVKVMRGGSWFNTPDALRVALRNFAPPDVLNEDVGFRCAKDIK